MVDYIEYGVTGGYTGPFMPDVSRVINRNQPDTNNYINSNYFKVVFTRLPTMTYFCQSVNVPSLSFGTSDQMTSMGVSVKRPGTQCTFEQLNLSFLLDESLKNWTEIFTWMESLANYETNLPTKDSGPVIPHDDIYSDARIIITNSAFVPKYEVVFSDVLPVSLGGWQFNSTEVDSRPIIVQASFVFTTFRIEKLGETTTYRD